MTCYAHNRKLPRIRRCMRPVTVQQVQQQINYLNAHSQTGPNETNNHGPIVPCQGAVPSNVNFTGDFNFHMDFELDTAKITKGLTWTYSRKCQRMFVGRNNKWPIRIYCQNPPDNCYIRGTLVYTQAEHMAKPVDRCPIHKPETTDAVSEHVLRCIDGAVIYQSAPDSKRLSVAVPYTAPQVGNTFTTYFYSLSCLTSCIGGMNRRPVKLVVTLEQNGDILGRAVVDVKCSASPGRDRGAEEDKLNKDKVKKRPRLARQNSNDSTGSVRMMNMDLEQLVIPKRRKLEGQIFNISVDNEGDFRILQQVANGLKLLRTVQGRDPIVSNVYSRGDSQSQEQQRLLQPGTSGVGQPVKMEADSSQATDSSEGENSQNHQRRGITMQKLRLVTKLKMESDNE